MDHSLSETQKVIWKMMPIILDAMQKNDLHYYMLGGTLLGAVRHQGFIPWDDDIDLGMPRADYDRFLEIIAAELPPHLALRTYTDDSPHHYYFSRIVDTRYKLRRTGSSVERDEEVWVDIFPLDGMPNNGITRALHKMRLLYARARYHIATFDKVNVQRPGRPLSERIIIAFIQKTGMGTRSDARKWLDRIDDLLRRYPPETSERIVNFMGQYKFKEMFPKTWYGSGKEYPFENGQLIGPVEADKVLSRQYGDYMTEPEDKNAHKAEWIRE